MEEPIVPARETDHETLFQSIDRLERKTMESTSMPNLKKEQENKTIEFSPIGNVYAGNDKRRFSNEKNVVHR